MKEFIMLIGLPRSGKSTRASSLEDAVVISCDAVRKEILGDENDQTANDRVFDTVHKRIRKELCDGTHKTVVFDATNINKKRRIAFLSSISRISCTKKAVLFAVPVEQCIENDSRRDRTVGESVILKMRMQFCPPHISEGFDSVEVVHTITAEEADRRMKEALDKMRDFDQDNPNHRFSLLRHCLAAEEYICERMPMSLDLSDGIVLTAVTAVAARLHDIGKLYTKTYVNSRGETTEIAHYYSHENVGAYEAAVLLKSLEADTDMPKTKTDDVNMYICNLIYYHMRPYTAWSASEKSKKRDTDLLGLSVIRDIELLHEADVAAH